MLPLKKYFQSQILKTAVQKFNTPLYVYSGDFIIDAIKLYKRAFSEFSPLFCYALKANSNKSVCSILAKNGMGADIVSGGELFRALKAGFPKEKIVFSGVGKMPSELEYAVKQGMLMINIESSDEMFLLEKIAGRLKKSVKISIRINPNIDSHTHKFINTGTLKNKFGVPVKEALKMYNLAKSSKYLNPVGIHAHIGSQIQSAKPYDLLLNVIISVIENLKSMGICLKYADIGGGWGVDADGFMISPKILADIIKKQSKKLKNVRLILEPGRSIVSGGGVLITKVLRKKKNGKKLFIITDAAMTDFIRPAFYGAKHPVYPLDFGKGKQVKADIVGPVCESGDFLAKDIYLNEPKAGDLLYFSSAGAYGFSMSSQYNSRPRVAEVLIFKNKIKLARKRETYRDLISKEI